MNENNHVMASMEIVTDGIDPEDSKRGQKRTMRHAFKILISLLLFLSVIVLSILLVALARGCKSISMLDIPKVPVPTFNSTISISNDSSSSPGRFGVVGDLQRTSFFECAIGREVNDGETDEILSSISGLGYGFVVTTGDMVYDGSDEGHWEYLDNLLSRAGILPGVGGDADGTKILPVVGNHEYWGDDEKALENVRIRFPDALGSSTWYSRKFRSLGLIFLDGNHDVLSPSQWSAQVRFFSDKIREFDADDTVRGIIIFTHQPPYTNSLVVSGDEKVRAAFVPLFCETAKSRAFISAHAHGYERFKGCGNDKMFFVSAGGGGPRPKGGLRRGEDVELVDEFVSGGGKERPFNWLTIDTSREDGIEVVVNALGNETLETVFLEFD